MSKPKREWHCCVCAKLIRVSTRPAWYCFPCYQQRQSDSRKRTGRNIASSKVHAAIQRGDLPRLDGSIPCNDCGRPARDYDHRDYNKPLEVDPVCHPCNLKRGPAIPLSREAAAA